MSKHVEYKCSEHGGCKNEGHCQFCEGGLFSCTVCGGAEGSLSTHCPGVALTDQQLDDIYAGKLDYKDGRFIAAATGLCSHHYTSLAQAAKERKSE